MKKKIYVPILVGCLLVVLVISCNRTSIRTATPATTQPVSATVLSQIGKLGFSTVDVQAKPGGYLVEGDIFLPASSLGDTTAKNVNLLIARTEQYQTNNLVQSLPRTINVVVSGLGTSYLTAADTAIARYNHLAINITFQRVSSGGDITITGSNDGANGNLASSGFPTSTGAPYSSIHINTYYFDNTTIANYTASVIQHEMGHCVGLRHTDYMNRAYSCGGAYSNEGAGTVGAILIPGTPSAPESTSVMLACNPGVDRKFNANDVVALNYLYGAGLNLPNPFYRYRHTSNNRHFLTTDYGELFSGMNGYVYEGIQCKIYSKQLSGTIAFYRFNRTSDADFIYQTSNSPISGYVLNGICGYVYSTQVTGTIPLYRFYNGSSGHFFTTNYSEGGGFTYEGVAAYVISN